MGLNVKVSLSIFSLALPMFYTVTVALHIYSAEEGDLSGLLECLFINDLPFSIKMSYGICDA